jgi:hypothetical protein
VRREEPRLERAAADTIVPCSRTDCTITSFMKIAAHESPRTTKLYDRTEDQLTLDEIEKISV